VIFIDERSISPNSRGREEIPNNDFSFNSSPGGKNIHRFFPTTLADQLNEPYTSAWRGVLINKIIVLKSFAKLV
jgi:hypothetical protein